MNSRTAARALVKKRIVRVRKRGRKKVVPPLKERAELIYRRLNGEHPDAHCELDHETPLQLLIATILSAQCTDKRVNLVTPELFRRFQSAAELADASPEGIEDLIRTTGFFRNKTKSLLGMARGIVERHQGEVPATMDELTKLPGVGRKTANVILGNAFHTSEGVVVDTHVGRLSVRLGLTRETDPVKVERQLMKLYPRKVWAQLSHLLIFHGRRICIARSPKCELCVLGDICPSSRV